MDDLLLACYLSGQMSEADWQWHLRNPPASTDTTQEEEQPQAATPTP
jgi:hypothetical protein